MSDLKPCPFCGGDAYTEIYIVEAAAGCRECQFKVTREHRPYEYDGLPKVIAAWNRRALPAVQHDADELVGHMTKLIAAGLDRVEQLTAERDEAWAMVAKADTQMCQSLADNLQAKVENNRLRVALDGLLTLVEHANFAEGWCCCGDDMLHHQNPMDCGHTPVDMGEYHASLAIKEARAVMKGDTP